MKTTIAAILCLSIAATVLSQDVCPPKLAGCWIFTPKDEWNRPIVNDPVDFRSSCIIQAMEDMSTSSNGPYVRLDLGHVPEYGIPWVAVDNPPTRELTFGAYPDESDCLNDQGELVRGCDDTNTWGWKAPVNVPREGDATPNDPDNDGDRHTIVIDSSTCTLYETFGTSFTANGLQADSSAIYNLTAPLPQRPDRWTSADAAGLPILPGLLKYEDIQAGEIKHAIRFTVEKAARAYTHPASHYGPNQDTTYPYYGARLRLRANFSETGYSPQGVLFIQALKKYGMVFADQGTGVYISGTSSDGWADEFIEEINQPNNPPKNSPAKRIHISNFEVVQSPNPVVYGWQANPVCDTKTQNDQVFTPVYPTCAEFDAGNTKESNNNNDRTSTTTTTNTNTITSTSSSDESSDGSKTAIIAYGMAILLLSALLF